MKRNFKNLMFGLMLSIVFGLTPAIIAEGYQEPATAVVLDAVPPFRVKTAAPFFEMSAGDTPMTTTQPSFSAPTQALIAHTSAPLDFHPTVKVINFNVTRPSESIIANHKAKIKTEMRWNQVARLGVTGAKWGIGAFTAYKIMQSFGVIGGSAPVQPVLPVKADLGANAAGVQEIDTKVLHERLIKAEQKLAKHESFLLPSFLSFQWFKNAGYVLSEHFLAAIAAATIYRATEQFINDGILHKGDISWFIGTKTNLLSNAELMPIVIPMAFVMESAVPLGQLGGVFEKDMSFDQKAMLGKYAAMMLPQNNLRKTIFEELRSYAAAIDDSTATALDRQPTELIVSACNSLVSQIESIIGFMEYKQESFSDAAKAEAASSGRYIFNVTNEFCQKIEAVFTNTTIDAKTRKNQAESVINSFKNDIARLLISFSRIEKDQSKE
jgi:hypothetical protein